MNKRLIELSEKEKISSDEWDEISEMEEVKSVESNGMSGHYVGYIWYTVYLKNGEETDVYVKD